MNLMHALHPDLEEQPFNLHVLGSVDPAVDWRPEPNETLTGSVTHVIETTMKGKTFPVLYLLDEARFFWRVRCSALLLYKCAVEQGIRVGDIVEITFYGMKTSQSSGREYKDIELRRL